MENVYNHYRNTINDRTRQTKKLQKNIHLLGTIRLLIAIAAIATIWILRESDWKLIAAALSLPIITFTILMVYHTSLSNKKTYAETLINLCTNELKGLDYDFTPFDGAPGMITAEHPFSLDLDIFGRNSLFQSINRTVTVMGRERLATIFTKPLTGKNDILQRQKAIKELTPLATLRQNFYVNGLLKGQETDNNNHLSYLLNYLLNDATSFANKPLWKISTLIAPPIWILIIAGLALGYVSLALFGALFALSAITVYAPVGKINKLHLSVNRLEKILLTYSALIKSLENATFTSDILSDISKQLKCKEGTASKAIKKLSAHIGILDQRASFTAVLLNIFTFREIRAAIAIEQWKTEHGPDAQVWLNALAEFDALSSFAGFAFNHPQYIYPNIADKYFEMTGKALGHPLINRNTCVKNDIKIDLKPSYIIITGANMAGKSTYLRTIGINFLLATTGAPVCADELTLYPANLVTSLRTSDSLTDNESYFFAELKRLKMIIDRLHKGEKLFIILDEILKGTNSEDKQKGSLALMKQLLTCNSRGIIATHDLALGNLEADFPDNIKNYRFEADITGNSLTFSYKLKEGIAQNMNACFLMRKMGIAIAGNS